MGMFDKFCHNKETEGCSPIDESLPNHFDTGRRCSVSAECWLHSYGPISCGNHSRRATVPQDVTQDSTSKKSSHSTSIIDSSPMHPADSQSAKCASSSGSDSSVRSPGSNDFAGSLDSTAKGNDGGSVGTSAGFSSVTHSYANPTSVADISSDLSNSNLSDAFSSEPVQRSPEEMAALSRCKTALRNTIFFAELSDDLMEQVLDAIQFRDVEAHVDVIRQGEEGNHLFMLDDGEVEFFVDGESKGTAYNGSTFGELALLYNSPRAATVHTLKPCKILTLDRITFKRIMVAKHSRKRMHSQQVLSQIDVFAQLPGSMQLRIADALCPATFKKGEHVIEQGHSGTDFFLIDEGTVDVVADGKTLTQLGPGSYFGELALIYDLPRAATVIVSSERLKVEILSSKGFQLLIGPDLVAELRKRDPRGGNLSQKLVKKDIQIQAQ